MGMHNELLSAFSVGLVIMSTVLSYYCVRFQYLRASGAALSGGEIDISSMVWGILCLVIGINIQSILYILWDFDVIQKNTQYKLSILPRTSLFVGLCFFFRALEVAKDRRFHLVFLTVVIMTMVSIYIVGVLR